MKQLNLDDYGNGRFAEEELTQLISWYKGKKINPKRYRQRFNLFGGYGEKSPYVFVERLRDWRRWERLYHKTGKAYSASSKAYWDYLRGLWKKTKKEMGAPGKNLQGVLLQELPAPNQGKKKKVSPYLLVIEQCRSGYDNSPDAISTTHRDRKELRGEDARFYWGFMGSEEEEIASALRRRNDVCQKRFQMAQSAFHEAVKIRLAGWWKHQAEEAGESQWGYRYSQRKVFTAIENDGRSYGWVSGMGGQGDLVWSPDEPPIFFK